MPGSDVPVATHGYVHETHLILCKDSEPILQPAAQACRLILAVAPIIHWLEVPTLTITSVQLVCTDGGAAICWCLPSDKHSIGPISCARQGLRWKWHGGLRHEGCFLAPKRLTDDVDGLTNEGCSEPFYHTSAAIAWRDRLIGVREKVLVPNFTTTSI